MLMEQEEHSTGESQADENISRGERKRIQRLEAKKQRDEQENLHKKEESKKNLKRYFIIGGVALIIILGIFGIVKATSKNYDNFAQCLKEKDVVIYGNEWCQYTQRQKSLFGSAFSKMDYVICDENTKLCDEKRIRITPTWEINGRMIEQVQNLKTLSEISGCPLK